MSEDTRTAKNKLSGSADLRDEVAQVLLERAEIIINDSIALFPFSAPQPLDSDYCGRLGQILVPLLAGAVRDGRVDSRSGGIANLQRLVAKRAVPVEGLFNFAYLTERAALDELALDGGIGLPSETWPLVAQFIRRASFDLLAAYADRLQQEPTSASITDRLTTLYSRPMMDAVLSSTLQRAERGGWPIALVMFDIDGLSEINEAYGYGVGDRVLERMGIQMRKYFREEDWVFRYSEDSLAVLLAETSAADAEALARHFLGMVEERLGFRDHRTESRVGVTASAAVAVVQMRAGDPVDAERMLVEAEAALDRAKRMGRSSIERTEILAATLQAEVGARYLDCSPSTVEKLIADGTLKGVGEARDRLADRQSVEAYRRQRTR